MTALNISLLFSILTLSALQGFTQSDIHHKVKSLHHKEKSQIKQPIYEFLTTWNATAGSLKPAAKALKSKTIENKQKGKDPKKGTEKLQQTYDNLVELDGKERSFLAETFALPMLEELKAKGTDLGAADIYATQYVIKFVLGVPKFNHGELDIDDLDEMERELTNLINTYPDNDAHNQEVDGHVIDIVRDEAQVFFTSFVAANKKQYHKEQGNQKTDKSSASLSSMDCGEKYEYLKEKGIMH